MYKLSERGVGWFIGAQVGQLSFLSVSKRMVALLQVCSFSSYELVGAIFGHAYRRGHNNLVQLGMML